MVGSVIDEEDPLWHSPCHLPEQRSVRPRVRLVVALSAVLAVLALVSPAYAQTFTFTKIADSARDDFNPNSFTCASINNAGDIAFKAGRTSSDGLNSFDGVYRANADGTTRPSSRIREEKRFGFIGNFPSMNDSGQVSFAANLAPGSDQSHPAGQRQQADHDRHDFEGVQLLRIRHLGEQRGEVAFKAELDPQFDFDEGLFSGSGRKTTTHYRASTDVSLDAAFRSGTTRVRRSTTAAISPSTSRSAQLRSGHLRGTGGRLQTIAAPAPDGSRSFQEPTLNDEGTAAFETSFFDENGQFVTGDRDERRRTADDGGGYQRSVRLLRLPASVDQRRRAGRLPGDPRRLPDDRDLRGSGRRGRSCGRDRRPARRRLGEQSELLRGGG